MERRRGGVRRKFRKTSSWLYHPINLPELVLRSGEYAIRELTVDGLVEIIKAQGLQYRHIFVKVKFSTIFF
jgi:N-methylhydantoinase B/oxoprolinase/acetone carboxylase alpha subunit